jgi:hypothetical protein
LFSSPETTESARKLALLGLILVALFLVGWVIARGALFLSQFPVMATIENTYQQQYSARVTEVDVPRIYYVFAEDLGELEKLVEAEEDILKMEKTRFRRLATVSVEWDSKTAFSRIQQTEGVDTVLSVPFFCH